MSRPESLADAFLTVMERVRRIEGDPDDTDRHTYWKLRQLAESHIADGFRRAADIADVALTINLARRDARNAQGNVDK